MAAARRRRPHAATLAAFARRHRLRSSSSSPNFLGCIEELRGPPPRLAHAVQGAARGDRHREALVARAARVARRTRRRHRACGEAQSFGVPMGFRRPAPRLPGDAQAGCVRQMPGRLVGETVDARGKRGFVLTLSTREQHIRRERATSNICTNQGLCLTMATIYLSLMGRTRPPRARGAGELSRRPSTRARVTRAPGLALPSRPRRRFNEFVGPGARPRRGTRSRAPARLGSSGPRLDRRRPELERRRCCCASPSSAPREAIDRWVEVDRRCPMSAGR